MNITDEMATTNARKVKAMRTSVGWFSSPSFALMYQCSKYVAIHSSKGTPLARSFGSGWMWSTTARRRS
eukprot:4563529-Pleurochrysis_carterae.AAC.1